MAYTKGKPKSEESNKKVSETLKENYRTGNMKSWSKGLTKETDKRVKKISEIVQEGYDLGRVSPFKGKKHTEEAKRKNSESHKGKKFSEETIKKRKETIRKKKELGFKFGRPPGIPVSEETRKRMSKSGKGRIQTPEHKRKNSEANKGRIISPESRKKTSETLKEGYRTGRINKSVCSKEGRKQISIKQTESWLTGKRESKGKQRYYKSGYIEDLGHYVRSSWEKEICLLLKSYGIDYEYEKKRYKLNSDGKIISYLPDLYISRYDLFVEIKGFFGDKLEKKKIRLFRNQIGNIKLIDSKRYKRLMSYKEKDTLTFEKLESVLLL